jgi:hypothetical protein
MIAASLTPNEQCLQLSAIQDGIKGLQFLQTPDNFHIRSKYDSSLNTSGE